MEENKNPNIINPDDTLELLKSFLGSKGTVKERKAAEKAAKYNYSLLTGENQTEYLIKYRDKETKAQKKQRHIITNSRTVVPSHKIMRIFDGVEQANNYFEDLAINDDKKGDAAISDFQDNLNTINKKGLKPYLFEAMKRLTFFDPNAYMILSGKDDMYEIKEIPGKDVYEVGEYQNQINYIIFKVGIENWIVSASSYYCLIEVKKDDAIIEGATYTSVKRDGEDVNYHVVESNDEYGFSKCPAFDVGYIRDITNTGPKWATPLTMAKPLFKDLIRDKSEYDLAKFLHGFIKKYAYVPACNHMHKPENKPAVKCKNGYLDSNGTKCPACKGTGMQVHFTTQDLVLFKINSLDEVKNIGAMTHTESIPIDIIKAMKVDYRQTEDDIIDLIFNSDQFTKKDVAPSANITAIEKKLNRQGIQSKFVEYSNKLADLIVFFTDILAEAHNVNDMITHSFGFSNDFQVETLPDLFENKTKAIAALAPQYVLDVFDNKILYKILQGDPMAIKKVKARESWRPFRGMSDIDKTLALELIDTTDLKYQLFINFSDIMDRVEEMQISISMTKKDPAERAIVFADISRDGQEELIREVIKKYFPTTPQLPTGDE